MHWGLIFSRETRHLRIMATLLIMGAVGGVWLRQQLVPASFGEHGAYRGDALKENASRSMHVSADVSCLKCHDSVREERAESPHQTVACMHCHGQGREHITQAELAAKSPDHTIPPAAAWDGKFPAKIDLFITQDQAICLSCHKRVVGMPEAFRSIDLAEHLEEQGASEPNAQNSCFECHTGHSPGL